MEKLLRRGDRGPYVLWVREDLQRLGRVDVLDEDVCRRYDDVFDTALEAAVIFYQSARGLEVDGTVGPQTWPALEGDTLQFLPVDPFHYLGDQTVYGCTCGLSYPQLYAAAVIEVRTRSWLASKNYGLSERATRMLIAGMIAAAMSESQLDPKAKNPRSTATGLFQVMSSFWDMRPSRVDREDPWRNTDLILYDLASIRASRRKAIFACAERGRVEDVTWAFSKYVLRANDRDTKMEWRRKIARKLFGDVI